MNIDQVMRLGPVIPVIVVDDVAAARPLAERLVAAGMAALEVTLRTPAALDAIAAMAEVPGAVVGAGTVLNEAQLDAALAAGARFIVSPGLTDRLARAAIERGVAYLPGIATAADIMRGLDHGLDRFKFFPAVASGGIATLTALAAPFRAARFCPTGGITAATAPDWLAVPAVLCVGGSWMTAVSSQGSPHRPSRVDSAPECRASRPGALPACALQRRHVGVFGGIAEAGIVDQRPSAR